MNTDQIKVAREKVDKIFDDMQLKTDSKASNEQVKNTSEGISGDTSEDNGVSLAQVLKCAGIDVDEDLKSSKYTLVMKNMGDNEMAVMKAFKGIIPLLLIKLIRDFDVPMDKIKELGTALTELANVYTYAIIKMASTEDISTITTPSTEAPEFIFFAEPTLKNKVLYIISGYQGAMLGITELVAGPEESHALVDISGEYLATMSEIFVSYVVNERKENGLKEA
jgi:hypothetical protein